MPRTSSSRRFFLKYLLDTNVISEFRKLGLGRADENVAQWSLGVKARDLYLSVISIQELETGILLAHEKDPVKASILRTWLERQVLPAFDGRIFAVDLTIARRSAGLHVPKTCPQRDALLAATALVHGLIVVTRNLPDFARTGVPTLNPWSLTPPPAP